MFADDDDRYTEEAFKVIKETIKKDLPAGFQRSEFLLEHGFLDFIVDRKDLKNKLSEVAYLFKH
jgi:acetyl-CoA carboxylase carboxyl transferase subunit beta